jgi:hypothetical protein
LRFIGPATLRYQEISDASRKLREFAKVENVPVLMLSSITETGDKNQNRRPTLADLKGSGDLAFHADVAILIHRDRGEDGASIDTRTELVVAKQRGGRTGAAGNTSRAAARKSGRAAQMRRLRLPLISVGESSPAIRRRRKSKARAASTSMTPMRLRPTWNQ